MDAKLDGEKVLFKGRIFEVVRQSWRLGSGKTVEREIARRAPGTRIILHKNGKILIIREFRFEHNDWDCRLPGGKVFDTLEEYKKASGEDMLRHAESAAKRELLEETGLAAKGLEYLCMARAGATVEWDLYYFVARDFEKSKEGTKLGADEIIHPEWKSAAEVKRMCLDGSIKEDRTVGVLLRYLSRKPSRSSMQWSHP